MIDEDSILVDVDERGLATVTLNRPRVHNAFDSGLIERLTRTLDGLEENREVRVIRLSASGKTFSAGADLNWMRRMATFTREDNLADARALAGMLQGLASTSKPTVAAVQGPAYGGGVGLVAACDLAVASTNARFCFSEAKLGLIPAVISPFVVTAIGARAAKRYFLTAETFDAVEAHRLGLVHEVVEPDQLDGAVERLVDTLLGYGTQTLTAAKSLVETVRDRSVDEDLLAEVATRIAHQRASPEGREGIAAFLEKRKPVWPTNSSGD